MSVEKLVNAQTTTYAVQFTQTHTEGISAAPIAGPSPQNASLARLNAPFETMSVYWTAVKEGSPPILPSHKSYLNNLNRVFLGGERVGVVYPTLVGHIWMAAGRYDYVIMSPEGLSSRFCLNKLPWEGTALDNAVDFYVPSENFESGILNPTWIQPVGITPDIDVSAIELQMGIRP